MSTAAPAVEVGQELAFLAGMGRGSWTIAKVDKITPSGRIVVGRWTLNPDLSVRGWSYGMPSKAHEVTEEIREKVRRQKLVARLTQLNPHKYETSTLQAIADILDEDGEV